MSAGRVACVWLLLAAFLTSPRARAQDPQACATAYEDAQRLRKQSKLLEARAQLILCSQPTCPVAAQTDCVRWLGEVEESLPSVVFTVRDASGHETSDARVLADGRALAERCDGKAVAIDPGLHAFRVVRADGTVRERLFTVLEGRRAQLVELTFAPATPGLAPSRPPSRERPIPLVVFLLGGVSLAGLASFATFGLVANGQEHVLRVACSPLCKSSDISLVHTNQIIADASLAVSVLALGAATWLYFARPEQAARRDAALRLVIAPAYSGVTVGALGEF